MGRLPQDALSALEEAMADGDPTHEPDEWARKTVGHHLRHLAIHLLDFAIGRDPRINLRNAACRGVLALAVYLRSAESDSAPVH